MDELRLTEVPVAEAALLIRQPVAEVFEAFIDPQITTKFWFSKSSGRLEAGKTVRWDWEMYGASSEATAKRIEPNRRILIDWTGYGDTSEVEWIFEPRGDRATFVSITHRGFKGDGDSLVKQARDSTGGFNLVLAGAKAFLEHGIELELVASRHPAALVEPA
jgi:uncharacterized protein YndB with AHSA1/START domain